MEWEQIGTVIQPFLIGTAILLVIGYIAWQKWKKQTLYFENQYLLLQQNIIKEHHELVEEQLRAAARARHDIADHLQTVETLISTHGDQNQISQYTERLKGMHKKLCRVIYCNNSVINSVLHNKMKLCTAENIKVTMDMHSFQEGQIEDIDILSILYNVLNNAIEACQKVEPEKRFLEFSCGQIANQLIIKIKNSMKADTIQKQEKKLLTSKKDKYRHGYGMQIVADTVKKHNGTLLVDAVGEIFTVIITLEN